jgi:pheromone shutdown-related protein TraB
MLFPSQTIHQQEMTISLYEPSGARNPYPSDVHFVTLQEREILLIGTAHVSQESATLVRQVISQEYPDCVCVELDPQRFAALSQERRWENLNLRDIIRTRQLSILIVTLILAAYQKKLGGQLGVMPGAEMVEAVNIARAHNIPIALCDRDVRLTLKRAWRSTPFFKKLMLVSTLVGSVFEAPKVSEETLREIRQQDVLTELLEELGKALPTLRQVLIDERDQYLAEKIRQTAGRRLVAVVGAAHVNGIRATLLAQQPVALERLETVPPASRVWQWVGWGIPALIVGALLYIAWQKGAVVASSNALFWILVTGLPCALGALCALAHPVTVATAFIAAPITTLLPVIGAGYVTALVQAYLRPPLVREFQSLADDIYQPRKWLQNRVLRIFLTFLLPNLGSAIGASIGGYEIISNLF